MLKVASLSLAALLALAPPVLAKNTSIAHKAPAEVCLTPEVVLKTAPAPLKFDRKVEGAVLKGMMARSPSPNADVDLAEIFDKDGGILSVFVTFRNGCMVGYGAFPTSEKGVIFGVEDGKI
jgi:hypothetical protein